MKKAKEYLFSYGILQKEKFQMEVLGRILQGESDSLRGYKLSLFEIKEHLIAAGHHPMAMPTGDKTDIVDGTVFEISKQDLELLDSYKIDDYKRTREILDSGKQAWVYIAG